MKDFVLIFRGVNDDPANQLSQQQMQDIMTNWQNWMGGIAAQNKLASRGYRLGDEISTLKPGNVVTDGPYAEIKEMLSGLIVVKADSLAEAKEIAKGCPILQINGSVEVRSVIVMG
ncbi:transcription initiation protein [Mucilaginibacter sp. PPCGB 2223]|uniref:YciI family protein n=1 Tax=Mucilaginibacter sp. PPCGB 2223 TaxID=1886027 RepID=UPI000824564E|nr:YciI family protein [Mucilaginibacter sp. PPCGB 2223]OCX53305.1 transcription initiation protein [Mucilaginibacter sp. PPCGB 2223]